MTRSYNHHRRAFTLVELVTVVAILGLVGAAVMGGTLNHLGEVRARAAASRLAADVRFMQRLSLASGLRTWIVFNVAGANYQLYLENLTNPGKAGRVPVSHPLDQSTGVVQFGQGPFLGVGYTSVNINATTELEFDSFGTPYDGNGIALSTDAVITLTSGVTATIRPVTGFLERTG